MSQEVKILMHDTSRAMGLMLLNSSNGSLNLVLMSEPCAIED
jgi:hypothetical protein